MSGDPRALPRPTERAWAPGDVLDYTPRDRWCHEGIAIVLENGRLADTYWGSSPNVITAAEAETARLRFRRSDYREVDSESEWLTYAPADRQSVSSQHGLQRTFYVRVGAEPDLATRIANAREAVAEAQGAVDSWMARLDRRREDLAKLEAAYVAS